MQHLGSAVLDVLLGEYIQNLDQRQLELDVLNGHLLLQNLTIKGSALQRLQLPVLVKAGVIGRVELRIPWSKLATEPTKLKLDQLLLLIGPQSEAEWDQAAEAKREADLRVEEAKREAQAEALALQRAEIVQAQADAAAQRRQVVEEVQASYSEELSTIRKALSQATSEREANRIKAVEATEAATQLELDVRSLAERFETEVTTLEARVAEAEAERDAAREEMEALRQAARDAAAALAGGRARHARRLGAAPGLTHPTPYDSLLLRGRASHTQRHRHSLPLRMSCALLIVWRVCFTLCA